MDNLPELRDIHLPVGVSVFPPAYGWWVILCAVLAMIALYQLFVIIRRKSKKLYALRVIGSINSTNAAEVAMQISEILRRICVFKYKSAVVMFGQEWIDFLNQKSSIKLEHEEAELLINAPYMKKSEGKNSLESINKLKSFCKIWIGENL